MTALEAIPQPSRSGRSDLRLRIAGDDSVESIGEGWNEFLAGHHVGSLTRASPGGSFWECVQGGAASTVYELLLERARARHTVSVDVWAASHERARKVELSVAPSGAEGGVELALEPLFERAQPSGPLFDRSAERSADRVVACGFCHSVRVVDWCSAEKALRIFGIEADGPQPRLAPGLCDGCERAIYAACRVPRLRS